MDFGGEFVEQCDFGDCVGGLYLFVQVVDVMQYQGVDQYWCQYVGDFVVDVYQCDVVCCSFNWVEDGDVGVDCGLQQCQVVIDYEQVVECVWVLVLGGEFIEQCGIIGYYQQVQVQVFFYVGVVKDLGCWQGQEEIGQVKYYQYQEGVDFVEFEG